MHCSYAYDLRTYLSDRPSPNGDIITVAAVAHLSIIRLALQALLQVFRKWISRCRDRSADRTTRTFVEGASPIADKGTPVERRGRKTSGPRGDLPG